MDRNDVAELAEQRVEMLPRRRQGDAVPGLDTSRCGIPGRVEVHLRRAREQPACRLEQTACEVLIVRLVGDEPNGRETNCKTDRRVGVRSQVVRELVVELEAGDQYVE